MQQSNVHACFGHKGLHVQTTEYNQNNGKIRQIESSLLLQLQMYIVCTKSILILRSFILDHVIPTYDEHRRCQ